MLGKSFKLSGRHFQSWKSFHLSVKGFTVIVGPSDRGKSAILRSLRGILRNEVGANHITYGEKEVNITLEPEEGEVIALSRNAKTTNYTIGDAEFSKLAGGIPPAMEDLKCGSVDIGGVKLDPIFAGQFGQQFMLELSPNELNAIFGLFSSTEKLNSGKKQASLKNAELTSTAKYIATDIQESELKRALLASLVTEFDEATKPLEALSEQCDTLEATLNSLEHLALVKRKVGALSGIKRPIPSLDELESALYHARLIRNYIRSANSRNNYLNGASIEIPRTASIIKLMELIPKVNKYTTSVNKAKSFRAITKVNSDKWIQNIEKLQGIKTLLTMVTNYLESMESQKNLKIKISEFNSEYQLLTDRLVELQNDGVQCPNCGHYFNTGEKHGHQ